MDVPAPVAVEGESTFQLTFVLVRKPIPLPQAWRQRSLVGAVPRLSLATIVIVHSVVHPLLIVVAIVILCPRDRRGTEREPSAERQHGEHTN